MSEICLDCGTDITGPEVLCELCTKRYVYCQHGQRESKCETCKYETQLTAATLARERAEREAAACRRAMEDLSTENNSLTTANAGLVEALEKIRDMKINGEAESPKYCQASMYHDMRDIARKALAAQQEGVSNDKILL